jgi:fluoride ion exporter CrcB/FEX
MPKYLGQCKTLILCAKGALVGVMMNDLVKMHRINSVKICILVTNFYGSFVLYLLHVTLLTKNFKVASRALENLYTQALPYTFTISLEVH